MDEGINFFRSTYFHLGAPQQRTKQITNLKDEPRWKKGRKNLQKEDKVCGTSDLD